MKCDICEGEMILDDVNYHSKGNRDNYWICNNCDADCIQKIRQNKIHEEYWFREDAYEVIEYTKHF